MRSLVTVFLVVLAAASKADHEEWEQYKVTHRKTYSSPHHERYRRKIFMDTLKQIRKHNFEADLNMHTWYMGVNQFSDMTDNEVADTMTGLRDVPKEPENATVHDFGNFKAPPSVNWVNKGYVNEIVDQGWCGSCYAFGTVAAIEGAYKKAFKKLYKFSEQNIIDCTYRKSYYNSMMKNYGCRGGFSSTCIDYMKITQGLMLEKDYPYKSIVGKCIYKRNKAKHFRVKAIKRFYHLSGERKVRDAVALYGPAISNINADAFGFRNYHRGIFQDPNCERSYNHVVTIVGYGSDEGKKGGDYWLGRNSWGTHWGEDGYFRIARNKNDMCGITAQVEFPVLSG